MDKIDIRFIASQAQVSPATVSRVLNKTKAVSPELRTRVLNTIEKYDYRPNQVARGLINHKTRLIGIVTPKVSNAFHAELISQIEAEADRARYNVIISNILGNFENEKKTFRIMKDRQVDGIILLHENTPDEMRELEEIADFPIVLASVRVKDSLLPTVAIDDERAAFEAARYLCQLGHVRIAGVFSDSYSTGTLRRKGFLEGLQSWGIDRNSISLYTTECSFGGGIAVATEIKNQKNLPTAVFFASDEMAIGAINYFQDHGIRVPEDISVFSFDDIELSGFVRPRLSTIHQPIQDIGRKATDLLIKLIDEKPLAQREFLLPHQVIVRDSCANPRD